MNIDDPSVVGSYPHNKTKRSIHLADHTGHIEFVLWRERADNFHFSEGDVLSLENAVVSNFNNTISLTTTFETTTRNTCTQQPLARLPNLFSVMLRLHNAISRVDFVSWWIL